MSAFGGFGSGAWRKRQARATELLPKQRKDNFSIRDEYRDLVSDILAELNGS